MNKMIKSLAGFALGVVLAGCVTIPSEFNYARDAGASAELVMPYPIRVTSVNGRDVSLPPVIKFPYTVTVDAGASVVGFQYGESWGLGDESQLVRGPIMEVAFAAQPGEQYAIEFVPPANVRDRALADDYFSGFTAWLSDAGGKRTDAVPTGRSGEISLNLAGNLSASDTTASAPAVAPTADASERLGLLQQLWQKANAEERQAFMQWVVAPGN